MERYDSYKDSGVKWLGEIPSHWDSASLLYLLRAKISDGPHETPNLIEDGIPFISIDSLNDTKEIDFSVVKKFISYKDYERYCYKTKLEKGDVLFSKAATIGKTAIVGDGVFMVWSPLAILKPNLDKISSLYLYYIMNCKKAIEEVSLSGSKNTQINVGMRELEKIRIPIPSIEEQSKITYFLENETSKIDEAIAQQQKMIDLLNERKQIIINNAVTKGLNTNVPMKVSGVDWIGEIPEHWSICSIKKKARIILGKMLSNDPLNKHKYICAKDVHYGNVDTSDLKEMSFTQAEMQLYEVKKGDMLIVEGGAGAGGCAIFMGVEKDIYIQNSIMIVRGQGDLLNDYICYFMQSINQRGYVEYICNKATIPHFTKEKVGNVTIPLPNLKEQQEIVDYIDSTIYPINDAIQNYQKQISLLQERKQIIINDVVTGKVKVV